MTEDWTAKWRASGEEPVARSFIPSTLRADEYSRGAPSQPWEEATLVVERSRVTPFVAWLCVAVALGGAWPLFEMGGPGIARLGMTLGACGLVFIASALRIRRRFGGRGLLAWTAVAAMGLAFALGEVVADQMDLVDYKLGAIATSILLTLTFAGTDVAIHLLAKRPRRPALERDLPVALAVFAIGQIASAVLLFFALAVMVPHSGC